MSYTSDLPEPLVDTEEDSTAAGPSRQRRYDVFMLGWEFPPFISGGLGTACYGLTRAMSARGDHVMFVMPGPASAGFTASVDTRTRAVETRGAGTTGETTGTTTNLTLPEFENVEFRGLGTRRVGAYASGSTMADPPHGRWPQRRAPEGVQPADPVDEGRRFADLASDLAAREVASGQRFDVVHAHDWLTFGAASRVARQLKVPFVAHVHSTEYDRAGEMADPRILDAESQGLLSADAIIAVSAYTAHIIIERYGVDKSRVHVIHNAADTDPRFAPERAVQIGAADKIVLFIGRLVRQKNPLAVVRAAAKVIEVDPAVRFIVAGSGELATAMRRLAAELNIERHFLFAGFLRGQDVQHVYDAANVLVMPSVSEPFGMVSIEAMGRELPVIVSRQSGAAEALKHVLTVDFWDEEELASKIVSVLRDPVLAKTLGERGSFEVRQMRWSDAADAVAKVYGEVLGESSRPAS